jgi:hypothetical protein
MGKKVVRIRPRKQVGVQALMLHLGAVVVGPGACQGTVGQRADRTALGVEDHQGGMGCLAGSLPPRASTSLSPLTCPRVTASCAR